MIRALYWCSTAVLSVSLALIVVVLASCEAVRLYYCDDDGAAEALAAAAERWPETADVSQRLDVFCVADATTFQTCGRALAADPVACTAWLGGGPYRARVYVDDDVSVSAALTHEAQHWHLMMLNGDEGCPSHDAACGWVDG
jgi:hypothetical protein